MHLDQEWRDFFGTAQPQARRAPGRGTTAVHARFPDHGNFSFRRLLDQVRNADLDDRQQQVAELIVGISTTMATCSPPWRNFPSPPEFRSGTRGAIHGPDVSTSGRRCRISECLPAPVGTDRQRRNPSNTACSGITWSPSASADSPRLPASWESPSSTHRPSQAASPGWIPGPVAVFVRAEHYVVPEVTVARGPDGEYVVTTVNDHLPHIRISNLYKDLLSQAETSSEVREYVREKIKAGKFLIKSLHQRQKHHPEHRPEIVKRRQEFMEHGVAHLRPMTMLQVAEVVGVQRRPSAAPSPGSL